MIAADYLVDPDFKRRRSHRASVSLNADIDADGFARALCRIVDISEFGVKLQTYSALKRGSKILLRLPCCGPRAATVVWSDDFAAGCEFAEALSEDIIEALVSLDESLVRK